MPRADLHVDPVRAADPRAGAAHDTPADVVDLVFETLIRDFSTTSLDLLGKASSTDAQQAWVLEHVRKPVIDTERDDRIYERVRALAGAYVMPD